MAYSGGGCRAGLCFDEAFTDVDTSARIFIMSLKDKHIRFALKQHLLKRRPAASKILEELRIQNGNAIADVVAFYKEMHCYEIKGETDNVSRLTRQSGFYNLVFPKLTAVITKNHLKWAENNLPPYWGIILASEHGPDVILKYQRGAKLNPQFDKEMALMTLWKDELVNIAKNSTNLKVKTSHTRQELASIISPLLRKDLTLDLVRDAILSRQAI